MKKLSIILPLYRESLETVEKSIEVMKNLRYPNKEVIFIFEPDERHLAQFVRERGFDAILTEGGPNKSKANSLNVGFKHSTGDIIAQYDADTEPEPEQALKAIRALEGGYDVVSGYIISPTETFLQKMKAIDLLDYCSSLTVKSFPLLFGFSHYMRREVVEDLDGWSDDTVTEDTDFSMKLHLKGYKVGIINSPIYAETHRGFKNFLLQRARWMKGGFQIIAKWRGRTSELPFRKRLEFNIMRISVLMILPTLLLTIYNVYLLLIGMRVYYLWIIPLLHLIDYISTLFIITRRQLVKLEGVSNIDYLVYPVYRWLFWTLSIIVGFIDLKRRPLHWYRTVRE